MSESMTVEQAIEFAREWQQGLTVYPGATGWRVVCMVLADEVERLQKERDELRRRVEEMQHAIIYVKPKDGGKVERSSIAKIKAAAVREAVDLVQLKKTIYVSKGEIYVHKKSLLDYANQIEAGQ